MAEKQTKKNNDEKDRPPRYAGESDAALDRARRRREEPAPDRPEIYAIEPGRDPGTVTMPEHYFDPWADPMTQPKRRNR